MSLAVDRSQLKADAAQIRTALEHLSSAIQDTHHALGRIEERVDLLQTAFGGDAGGLVDRVEYAAQRGDELQRGIYLISANVDRLIAAADTVTARHERLQIGVDALRLDQRSLADATTACNQRLQIGVDALRVDQQANQGLRSDVETLISGQRALATNLSVGLDETSRRSEAILHQSRLTHELAGIMISRADSAMQRSALSLGSEILMRIPEGLLLVPAEDSALVAAMWESQGRLEPGTLKVLLALIQEGDTVVDVGANIGLVALPAARAVGPTGHVVALEPSTRIADLLGRSLFLNLGSGRATIHRLAAGETAGTALLHLGSTAGHSSLLPLPDSGRSEQIDVARLDDLIGSGDRIKLVKIDAEGSELAVWRGMKRIVAENPDLVVVVEFGPEHLVRAEVTLDEWLDAFLAPGFVAYEIDEITGRLAPLRPRQDLHRVVSLNLLLLKHPASAYSMLEFA